MTDGFFEAMLILAKAVKRGLPRSPQTCFFLPIYIVCSVRLVTALQVPRHLRGLAFSNEVTHCTTFTAMASDPS